MTWVTWVRRRRRQDQAGAAVPEFVLVSALLLTLFLGVVQLGIVLHVRTTLVACAAEGARAGARADRASVDAAAVTRQLVTRALPPRFAEDVVARSELVGGAPTVVVEVRAPLPVVGFLGPDRVLVVRGHALAETDPG
jgi:Flp pilus assembly protein TadG